MSISNQSQNALEERLSQRLDGPVLETAIARVRALPRYASEWERRVVAIGTDAAAIDAAIALLRTLGSANDCPEEWLFLLAWDNSVDVWDADWPEVVKRKVIDASWEVHRYKATRFAIRTALEAIGLSVELTRWFDVDPPLPRATFHASVYVGDDSPISPQSPSFDRLPDAAEATIVRTKPLTRHFTMNFGLRSKGALYCGATASARQAVRVFADAQPLTQQAALFAGIMTHTRHSVRVAV